MKQGIYEIEEFKQKWDFDGPDSKQTRAGYINRVFLSKQKHGFTLNACCGTDRTGDVLVDITSRVKPHVVADIHALPFRPSTFDTVICDPPFSYFNRFKWILDMKDLAKKRFIISTPYTLLTFGKTWRRKVWFTDNGGHMMRIWQVFTRDILQ